MKTLSWFWLFSSIFILSHADTWNQIKSPPGCDQSSCKYILIWKSTENRKEIKFSLSAKAHDQYSWAAVGWNKRPRMNGASVVDCIGASANFIIQSSYNEGHNNIPLEKFDTGLSKTSGYQDQERIYCNFTHSVSTPPEADPKLVQPLDQPYYIIMAYGAASAEGKLRIHHKHPFISKKEISLLTTTSNDMTRTSIDWNNINKLAKRPWLLVSHGVAMIAALLLCIGLSNLIARNMQRDWDKEVFGNEFWLLMHKLLILITFFFFLLGLSFVLIQLKGEIKITTHSILGFSTFSFFCANILLGLLRPSPYSDFRRFYNFFHAVFGHSVFFLAVASVFYGIQSNSMLLPKWVAYSILIYAAIKVLFHVLLNLFYKSDPQYKSLNERNTVYSFRTIAILVYICFSGCLFFFYLFFIIFYPTILNDFSFFSFIKS